MGSLVGCGCGGRWWNTNLYPNRWNRLVSVLDPVLCVLMNTSLCVGSCDGATRARTREKRDKLRSQRACPSPPRKQCRTPFRRTSPVLHAQQTRPHTTHLVRAGGRQDAASLQRVLQRRVRYPLQGRVADWPGYGIFVKPRRNLATTATATGAA